MKADFNQSLNTIEQSLDSNLKNLLNFDFKKLKNFFDKLNKNLNNKLLSGINNNSLSKKQYEIIQSIKSNKTIDNIIPNYSYIRHYLDILLKYKSYIKKNFNSETINHIQMLIDNSQKKKISILTFIEICKIFYINFYTLSKVNDKICDFIKKQLLLFENKKLIAQIKKNQNYLFSINGPNWLVNQAKSANEDLSECAKKFLIPENSEYLTSAKLIYFINTLKKLNVNQDDIILEEIIKEYHYNQNYDNNKKFGHIFLEILIDKLIEHHAEPSDMWKKVIVSIAGDPRIERNTEKYRLWWSILGDKRINYLCSCLSKYDMELFLNIISELFKNDPDKTRMFKNRKKLLNEIFSKNQVLWSCLYINPNISRMFTNYFKDKNYIPNYYNLKGGDVVFYYLVGNAHVIEGAHSFKMKILEKLPKNCIITNPKKYIYSNYPIDIRYFRSELKEQYENEFGNYGYNEYVHSSSGNWIFEVISKLKELNVIIREKNFYTQNDYYNYLKRKI